MIAPGRQSHRGSKSQNRAIVVVALLAVVCSIACKKESMKPAAAVGHISFSDTQLSKLASQKIFFGHQSVGTNVIQGIRDLQRDNPRLQLRIEKSSDPQSVSGSALVETEIGKNGDPESKSRDVFEIVGKGIGEQDAIVMFKYCYADFDSSTDVRRLFEGYRATIESIRTKYPKLKIIYVTVPLTTVESPIKAWLKTMLGRTTSRDLNLKRNEFNRLLRASYGNKDIFDLAEAESTHIDGSREFFRNDGDVLYSLCPEFTTDGGHLNEIGRRRAAEKLLLVLSTH